MPLEVTNSMPIYNMISAKARKKDKQIRLNRTRRRVLLQEGPESGMPLFTFQIPWQLHSVPAKKKIGLAYLKKINT